MLIQQVNRTDPDRVYVIARNLSASPTRIGDWGQWECVSSHPGWAMGIDVITPVSSDTDRRLEQFAGIWHQVVNRSEYGLIQIYGHSAAIRYGGASVFPGSPVKPVTAQSYGTLATFLEDATSDANDQAQIVVISGYQGLIANSVTGATGDGFIKAMGF